MFFFFDFYRAKNITRVGTKFGGFVARVSRSRLSAYRTRELARAFFAARENPLTWKAVNRNPGKVVLARKVNKILRVRSEYFLRSSFALDKFVRNENITRDRRRRIELASLASLTKHKQLDPNRPTGIQPV